MVNPTVQQYIIEQRKNKIYVVGKKSSFFCNGESSLYYLPTKYPCPPRNGQSSPSSRLVARTLHRVNAALRQLIELPTRTASRLISARRGSHKTKGKSFIPSIEHTIPTEVKYDTHGRTPPTARFQENEQYDCRRLLSLVVFLRRCIAKLWYWHALQAEHARQGRDLHR